MIILKARERRAALHWENPCCEPEPAHRQSAYPAIGGHYQFPQAPGAKPQSGVNVVINAVNLEDRLSGADFVFTGEGSLDFQTKFGRTPWGVMLTARKHNIPTIAFTGNLGRNAESLHENGFAAIIPTVREVGSLAEALEKAQSSLREAVRMTCRVLSARRPE